ncbi:MAG: VTT domain-containing protein [Candidatus Paceibacterota bacterium]|jgi:membrane protein DedA with SNARE-associated domain
MSESLFFYYLIIWQPLGYLLGVVGMIIEGDITWFTFAFLTSQGFFNLWLMLLVVFGGIVISDTLFFFVGRTIHRFPRFVKIWSDKIAQPFDRHIHNRPRQTLLISKFTYAVHKPILVRMGMTDKTYLDFMKQDLPGVFIWILVIGGLGYFSGLSFFLVQQYLRYAEVGLLLGLIIFFIAIKLITKYSIKQL